ncbi:ABC transporter permease [Nocardioides sp.]|uniref:ABC transporter permease n=1 Tax=Nocardioides sp. TaxID=35761 RepID=UPI003D1392BD
MPRSRLHTATIRGRAASAPGLLVLMGLVVALTTALTSAVAPLTDRTADRAIAENVRAAGLHGAVVATLPEGYDDPRGKTRDPRSVPETRLAADQAQQTLPAPLAAVLRPGVATITTPALQLLDEGPGRYLRLAYIDTPGGAPSVTYTAGGPPRASTAASGAGLWPVQVALSQAAARALGVGPGDRLSAEDEQHRPVEVRVSGVYAATEPGDLAWQVEPELLNPTRGLSQGVPHTSAAALVSPRSLPDLRLAVAADALDHRVLFVPEPTRVTWSDTAELVRAVASLEASAGLADGEISWDSLLGRVLQDARSQVVAARGQAQVLLVGLLACALLVLVQAAQLLVRRRIDSITMSRERGASLFGVGRELLVEAVVVAVVGAALGLATTWLLVGAPGWSTGWAWAVPVVVVAALAAPVMGGAVAGSAADARRVPANRSARRTAARGRRLLRLALEVCVVSVAALSFVALRQRGVTGAGDQGADLMVTGVSVWWAVVGAVLVLRLFPPAVRLALRVTRRTTGSVRFLVAARLTATGSRALALVVVSVALAQLTLGVALAATEERGQEAGALLAVGGEARLTTAPDPALDAIARQIAGRPGVEVAAAGRVAEGVRASARRSADTVRLVVVDATAYRDLLAASALPDTPQLALLDSGGGPRVPALLLGGDADLRGDLSIRWEDSSVPLEVVGRAPQVNASVDPVIVVDAQAFADTGALAVPDTVWAVGPGAASAIQEVAPSSGSVVLYSDVLAERRDAPLASGLVRLAAASAALLLLLAIVAVVLAAAVEAPGRAASLGRLRALGLRDRDLRRVLVGELLAPVLVASLTGLALGVGCAGAIFGSLSLQQITGQVDPPGLVVPWWTALAGLILVVVVLTVAAVEWRRLRRRALAQLLRS